ncbi:hypothetical protein VOM14_09530 [Paraburkholderia sp. MPAMCS5]|uniref:hypothetical protein n=1 Tax=Paraburkholderia sp. MPAMCS5 TaxID=3112563 RepID=UPI002E189C66|nr:hypothetical protein [Paraburkholderia sp. MPAMCS5]
MNKTRCSPLVSFIDEPRPDLIGFVVHDRVRLHSSLWPSALVLASVIATSDSSLIANQ